MCHHITDYRGIQKGLFVQPVHLIPDNEGNLPPSALIPFCSYQGKSSLLVHETPQIDNFTICNLFEPKIFEGQFCYTLDIALLKTKTKSGRANGLFLLLDPNPYPLHISEDNVQGSNDRSFKVVVHTLAQYTTFGPGSYEMSALKKMTGTNSFLQLPEEDKECLVHEKEECQTQKYLDLVQTECKCIPWALKTDKDKNQVKYLSFKRCTLSFVKGFLCLQPKDRGLCCKPNFER